MLRIRLQSLTSRTTTTWIFSSLKCPKLSRWFGLLRTLPTSFFCRCFFHPTPFFPLVFRHSRLGTFARTIARMSTFSAHPHPYHALWSTFYSVFVNFRVLCKVMLRFDFHKTKRTYRTSTATRARRLPNASSRSETLYGARPCLLSFRAERFVLLRLLQTWICRNEALGTVSRGYPPLLWCGSGSVTNSAFRKLPDSNPGGAERDLWLVRRPAPRPRPDGQSAQREWATRSMLIGPLAPCSYNQVFLLCFQSRSSACATSRMGSISPSDCDSLGVFSSDGAFSRRCIGYAERRTLRRVALFHGSLSGAKLRWWSATLRSFQIALCLRQAAFRRHKSWLFRCEKWWCSATTATLSCWTSSTQRRCSTESILRRTSTSLSASRVLILCTLLFKKWPFHCLISECERECLLSCWSATNTEKAKLSTLAPWSFEGYSFSDSMYPRVISTKLKMPSNLLYFTAGNDVIFTRYYVATLWSLNELL